MVKENTKSKPSLPELKNLILKIWPRPLEKNEIRQLARDARAADDPEKWLRDLAKLAETQAEPSAETPDPKSQTENHQPEVEWITIRVPFLRQNGDAATYLPRKLETQLDRRTSQATALRDIRAGLDYSHARLANGTPVSRFAEAARWLLEAAAIEMEKTSPHGNP